MTYVLASAVLVLVDVFTMLNVVLMVELFLGGKYTFARKQMLISAGCYAMIDIVLEYVFNCTSDLIVVIVGLVFMASVVWVLAREKRIRTALLTILAVFMDMQWGSVGDLIEMLLGVDEYYILVGRSMLSPFLPLFEVLLFVLLIGLRKYTQDGKIPLTLSVGERIFLGIVCFFGPMLTEILAGLEEVFQNPTYNLAWVVFVLALNVAVVYGIIFHKRTVYYRELSASYRDEFDKEYMYFKEYKDANQEISKFRHDWNNHMIVMQDLFAQGKFEEAQKYFEGLPQNKSAAKTNLLTGNETVDTILAAKGDLLEQHKIAVKLDGGLGRLKQMEPVDICILFANLVDNAIEALAQYEGERTLLIKVTESLGAMMLVLENPMNGALVWEGEKLKTSKPDAEWHGMGLRNVEEVVVKYRGECEIEMKGNLFVVRIVLPLSEG